MFNTFYHNESFRTEPGGILPGFHLGYTTYGKLNDSADNVVWVFHALTANSDAADWWDGLIGPGKLFDPEHYLILCVNTPGSCYGSAGPLSINPETNSAWLHNFPFFTIRDMIKTYQLLRANLGIKKIRIGIGGSMGGQQLLEWAVQEPDLFDHIIPLATNARHSPWGIAFNASQRLCIEVDPTWNEKHASAGINGMKVARSVALLSYRNYETYLSAQAEASDDILDLFKSESYQRYQGEKLATRFNAFSYYVLSKSMDSHNLGRGRTSLHHALKTIKSKALVIGISSDILFPVSEQQLIAEHIPGALYKEIDSLYGHDGFLFRIQKPGIYHQRFFGQRKRSSSLNN